MTAPTVLPIFIQGQEALPRVLGMEHYGHAGSALLLSPNLALTCDHVVPPEWEFGETFDPMRVVLGSDRHRVARIVPSPEPETTDLALLHLERPLSFARMPFSEQWLLDDMYAYGYRYPPFTEVERDGPVTLDPRSVYGTMPRQVRAAYGLPKGFSGGPLVGTFEGSAYCAGINWRGRETAATSSFIPGAACVAFVHAHVPGICELTNLAPRALLSFLRREEDLLRERARSGWSGPALMVKRQGFCRVDGPLTEFVRVNRFAHQHLALDRLPPCVAIPLDARELAAFLVGMPDATPEETLFRYLRVRRNPLRITQMLQACLEAGACVFLVTDCPRPLSERVKTFLSRLRAGHTLARG